MSCITLAIAEERAIIRYLPQLADEQQEALAARMRELRLLIAAGAPKEHLEGPQRTIRAAIAHLGGFRRAVEDAQSLIASREDDLLWGMRALDRTPGSDRIIDPRTGEDVPAPEDWGGKACQAWQVMRAACEDLCEGFGQDGVASLTAFKSVTREKVASRTVGHIIDVDALADSRLRRRRENWCAAKREIAYRNPRVREIAEAARARGEAPGSVEQELEALRGLLEPGMTDQWAQELALVASEIATARKAASDLKPFGVEA